MATATLDLGESDDPVPSVAVRFDGELGAPLLIVPAAVLSPRAGIEFAMAIFRAAATACAQAHLDSPGTPKRAASGFAC